MNCFVVPLAMLALVGVMAMDARLAAVTVRVVEPETLPESAVIVVEPAATEVANPFEPVALLIDATAAVDEPQVTVVVRF